jgi:hypothetical protein
MAAISGSRPSSRGGLARGACLDAVTAVVVRGRSAERVAELEHLAELAHRPVRAVQVRLVDHEDVGHLEDAGLDGLDVVTHPGHCDQHRGVRHLGDVDLVLADAHGLHHHHVLAHRVHHPDAVARRPGESPERSARRQRANEDVRV